MGHSEFKIDIGVINPKNPSEYLLGILLDGENYSNAKTTRDREIAQIKVLNDLGWKIIRVWTMDWWDNSKKELDRIMKSIKEAESNDAVTKSITEEKGSYPVVDHEASLQEMQESFFEEHSLFMPADSDDPKPDEKAPPILSTASYSATVLTNPYASPEGFVSSWYDKDIIKSVNAVIEHEAPICEALLMRRVVQSFGIARSGSRIQDKIQQIFAKLNWPYTKQTDGKVYWKYDQDPTSYADYRASGEGDNKRDAKEVPFEEARNAICHVLQEQISLSDDDLIREGAKILGYTRMGNVVIALMENGITLAKQQGRIQKGTNDRWILS